TQTPPTRNVSDSRHCFVTVVSSADAAVYLMTVSLLIESGDRSGRKPPSACPRSPGARSPGREPTRGVGWWRHLGLHLQANLNNLTQDVLLRHWSPVTAVGAVVSVVAHDEVVTLLDDQWAPVVVAAELGWNVVVVLQRDIVHGDATVDDPDRVPWCG